MKPPDDFAPAGCRPQLSRPFPPVGRLVIVVGEGEFFAHLIGPSIGVLSHEGDRYARLRVLERPLE
jgi:hypothetical protein